MFVFVFVFSSIIILMYWAPSNINFEKSIAELSNGNEVLSGFYFKNQLFVFQTKKSLMV